MACRQVNLGNGAYAIVCTRGERAKPCSVSGCGRPSVALCDYPLSGRKAGKTCDRALCAAHRHQQNRTGADTVDYCPTHDDMARAQPILPFPTKEIP